MDEEEFADIYYVDTRNAVNDHRTQRPSTVPWARPATRRPTVRPVRVPPTRTVYVPQQAQPATYAQPYPTAYPQFYPAQPDPFYGQQGLSGLLGRLTTGQIVEMIAQGFAAMQSLPSAPISTKELETDIANLVLYQGALASHAKRDEQWRTIGSLVAKLVG